MKKFLSVAMALCIVISSLFTGIYAMAEEQPTIKAAIETKMLGAAKYLLTEDVTFTEANAGDFITYIKSGADMSAYKESFVNSVKKNLDDNNGKIVITENQYDENQNITGTVSYESPAVYGGVIIALNALGYNPASFQGYNIASSYAMLDLSKNSDNIYHYYLAIEGAKLINNNDIAKTLCDYLVKNYYTMDKGVNYWGFSADNTAMFIIALAPYYNEYKAVVDNAVTVLETYKTNGGYFHMHPEAGSTEAVTANCNSTAYVLAAYSALGNIEKAKAVYDDLCKFESKNAGVFTYEGEENKYATKDALFALGKFNEIITPCYDGHKFPADGYKCINCEYTIPKVKGVYAKSYSTKAIRIAWDKVEDADSYIIYKYNDSAKKYEYIAQAPADATNYKVSNLKNGTIYKFRVSAVKDNKIGPRSDYMKATTRPYQGSIKSVTSPSRKKIYVKLNAKNCTGYQIQWSTSKNFTSNYKTVTFGASSKTKTIKTAQSRKKYYVRARAYSKVNGVKIYGKWSSVKSVTTK